MSYCESWKDAIITALRDSEAPLHYRRIWEVIKSGNIYDTKGKTPENTINYIINKSIKEEGLLSPFVFYGDGVYGLKEISENELELHPVSLRPETMARLLWVVERRRLKGGKGDLNDAVEEALQAWLAQAEKN